MMITIILIYSKNSNPCSVRREAESTRLSVKTDGWLTTIEMTVKRLIEAVK